MSLYKCPGDKMFKGRDGHNIKLHTNFKKHLTKKPHIGKLREKIKAWISQKYPTQSSPKFQFCDLSSALDCRGELQTLGGIYSLPGYRKTWVRLAFMENKKLQFKNT